MIVRTTKVRSINEIGDIIYPHYNGTAVWYKRSCWIVIEEVDKDLIYSLDKKYIPKEQHQIEIEQFKKDFKLFERVINIKQIENQKLKKLLEKSHIQRLDLIKELSDLKKDIKLAKQCVNFQGNICGNKDCKNTNCSRNEKEKGA